MAGGLGIPVLEGREVHVFIVGLHTALVVVEWELNIHNMFAFYLASGPKKA